MRIESINPRCIPFEKLTVELSNERIANRVLLQKLHQSTDFDWNNKPDHRWSREKQQVKLDY